MEDIGVSATTIENLERDFQNVISDLGGEDNLERFRLEYEKLHRALKKSHESEKRLIKKCQELTQELMANAAKIQSAIKLSQGDHSTIEALKKEIEKAWKMVDTAHEKESRAKETIQQLKKEATTLQQLVEQGTALTQGHEMTLAELTEEKKDLLREQDELLCKIEQLHKEIKENYEKVKKVELDLSNKQEDLKRVSDKFTTMKREYDREVKSHDRAESQCKELMSVLQLRNNELEVRRKGVEKLEASISSLSAQVRDDEARKQQLINKLDSAEEQLKTTRKGHDEMQEIISELQTHIKEIDTEMRRQETKLVQLRHEELKSQKLRDQRFKECRRMVQQKDDLKKEHEMLDRQVVNLKKQIDVMRKEERELDGTQKHMEKEHDALKHKGQEEVKKQEKVATLISGEHRKHDDLETALETEKEIGNNLKKTIKRLEMEREKYAEEASGATISYNKALEDVKIGVMAIDDLQKQIDDAASRLAEQQHMYEQVRTDRNLYSKKLIESQDEISELKQKFKIMDHQIDQLKEELGMKEKKHFEEQARQKAEKERLTKIRKQVNEYTALFEDAKKRTEGANQEIKQLTKVINQCDTELSEQQQQFLTVTNERDVLGTQLIRRNDELALLYEKIRIQQQTLSKGEVQYRDRLVDIRMLRLKIAELKRNVHMAQVRVKNIDDLSSHIVTLQRQLALERTKVQALSEELENPQNYSRWRTVKGERLSEEETVQKIQALQKRLIGKTEECVEKDIVIQEKEKLFIELKTILARQPGPEVAEQLNVYQQDLRKKNHTMKRMASELNMSSTHISEQKYEVERLNRELQDLKKKYFELRMDNQGLLEERDQMGPEANAMQQHLRQTM